MDQVIEELLASFRERHELADLAGDELFESFAAHCVLHQFHEESFAPDAHRVGGGNDLGIDAWGIVVNGDLHHDLDGVKEALEREREFNAVVIIVQAKTSASMEGKVIADLADNLRQVCDRDEIVYTASPEIRELQQALRAIYDRHQYNAAGSPRLEVRYVTCGGDPNEYLEEKCRSAERTVDALGRFDRVRFECIGARRLQRLYALANRKVRVNYLWANKSAMPPMKGVKQAWIGMLPAKVFVGDILADEGGSIRNFLFQDNLRPFLGMTNEVNTGIRQSLEDPVGRGRFAVLNNGITVIAQSFTSSGHECHMTDFQIVNGCQTGHVLFECRNLLTDDVHVKLTVIEPEGEDIVSRIVVATNKQTDITRENLAANETIHRDIEDYFKTTKTPRDLYYERRSNQFDTDTSITKTRIIKQGRLTQSYAAVFLGLPHRATRPTELLRDKKIRLYRDDHHPIAYYTAAAIWYQVEWLLRNQRLDRKWKPMRFLLMAALGQRLSGGRRLPSNPRKAKAHCEQILETVWDRARVEQLVCSLAPVLERLCEAEGTGRSLGDLSRTKTFADRFLQAASSE
ncbi:AIPR family protein [Glycomyces sp. L485]|uniref:AIPR family protein n=1 Tax=Glycomyces sp. L485 TaxID=2909235 RepID=UPI001F4B4F7E|nr:AIPR family protein [Glycomyces sp. L485]MCH7230892.1 AIPR family protein [Glycomyces sp. L485]